LFAWKPLVAMADMDIDQTSVDLPLLAVAASEFASYPGVTSDAAAHKFLSEFPLPVLLGALEAGSDVPGLETSVVASLERIFQTGYGKALLPESVQYANVGLNAASSRVRRLTCFAIAALLQDSDKDDGGGAAAAVRVVAQAHVAAPLLVAVADADASVAKLAVEALVNLAKSPAGLELLFTDKGVGSGRFKEMAMDAPATVRIRALAMAATIFGLSDAAAAAIQGSGVLKVLELELDNSDDMLAQLNAMELLCDLATTPQGARFLLSGNLIGRLISTFGNERIDSLTRSRALTVAARLVALFEQSSSFPLSASDASAIVSAIDQHFVYLKQTEETAARVVDKSEHESALDALALIGSTVRGAELLLLLRASTPPVARHLTEAAFYHRGDGVQLAGIHALASLAGSERSRDSLLLSLDGEAALKDLVYAAAAGRSSMRTPSGLFLNLLQQSPEVRLAMYRLIQPLLARPWCLRELSSNRDLIDILVDTRLESNKEAMEWRHACCMAMASALSSAVQRSALPYTESLSKLEEAVRKGPYASKKEQMESQPIVATQERM
jgi:26S proteasome non-ATPase regulatory subunit 5